MGRTRSQFGCLYKNGRLFWVKYVDANGEEHRVSTKTDKKSEAEKFRRNLLQHNSFDDAKHALEVVKMQLEEIAPKTTAKKDEPIRLVDMVDVLENDVNTSGIIDRTFVTYRCRFNSLISFMLKEKGLDTKEDRDKVFAYEVDFRLADKFLTELRKRIVPTTYNNYLASFNKVWRVCMKKDNNIVVNPFVKDNFSFLKASKVKSRADMTEEDIKKIQEHLKTRSLELQVLFAIGIYTGLRFVDCCTLKWSDVDFETGFIRRLPEKTKKNGIKAIVPIHPHLRELLKKLNNEYEYVLPSIATRHSSACFQRTIRRIFAKCGFETSYKDENGNIHPKYGFHCFRIHFATKCMRSGMHIKQIQTMLCHTSAEMSLSYMQVNEADLKLPNLDTELVGVRLERKLFDRVMAQAEVNESLADVVAKILNQIEQKQSAEEIERRRNNVMIVLANKYGIITSKEYYEYVQHGTPITLSEEQIHEIKLLQENDTF